MLYKAVENYFFKGDASYPRDADKPQILQHGLILPAIKATVHECGEGNTLEVLEII